VRAKSRGQSCTQRPVGLFYPNPHFTLLSKLGVVLSRLLLAGAGELNRCNCVGWHLVRGSGHDPNTAWADVYDVLHGVESHADAGLDRDVSRRWALSVIMGLDIPKAVRRNFPVSALYVAARF
jgi:hypothetical protein